MRIWSLHPRYLDSKGIVALWRETLLAKAVLEGKTEGYRNHPQLIRFKNSSSPFEALNFYLSFVYKEALERAYAFDKEKIDWDFKVVSIPVTRGQLDYEVSHLLRKLKLRDSKKYEEVKSLKHFEPNPIFKIISGGVESWEIVQ